MAEKPVEVWRVLLVDDDKDDYLITNSMLNQAKGRKVALEWAPTFEAGQRLLETGHYTAVLVDYDLGLRTGIELIRENVARGNPAPLILYTGRGGYEVDLEAMQAGATLYLSKTEATPYLLERSLRYAIERKRIEAELDRRLQERSHILESIQDGFFAIDRDWRITYINHRAARNGGFEPEELLGRVFWEAFPRLLGTPLEENYRYVMNERTPVQVEMQGVFHQLWYDISIYPSVEGISIFWQDITARKLAEQEMRVANELLQEQAEELELQTEELRTQSDELANANEQIRLSEEIARQRLNELEDLYHTAPVGLCVLDSQLRWVRINERLAEINGLPAAAHIGKRVRELLPHLAKEVEPRMRRVLETGEPQTGIEIISETPAQPDVQRSWLESWLPIMDSTGKATGLSIVVEETTERKRA